MKHVSSVYRFAFFLAVATWLMLASTGAQAQANVGVGTNTPNAKAALDISATDKGLLIPRLTQAQRTAITAPPDGLMVFQTDGTTGFWYYFGGSWVNIPNANTAGDNLGNHTATQNVKLGANKLTGNGGTTGISIANGGAVTADNGLTVTTGGATVTAGGLTVAAGGANIAGNTNVNTSGSATTSIGTGASSGAVSIGRASGTVTMGNLTGVGTRLVNVDASGNLSTQTVASVGDNLGTHTATQALNLATNKLVGNGGTTGLGVGSGGILNPDNGISLNDKDIYLRGTNTADRNHGLGWYGTGKTWDAAAVDGPVLYGLSGGVLGTNTFGTQNIALYWNAANNVGIGTTSPTYKLEVVGHTRVTGNSRVNGNMQTDGTLYAVNAFISNYVAIGSNVASASLDVDGAIAVRDNSSTTLTAANTFVTVGNRSYLRLGSNNITAANRVVTLDIGWANGQILFITNASSASFGVNNGAFQIADAGNVNLAAAHNFGPGDSLLLLWDGAQWIEIGFSNN